MIVNSVSQIYKANSASVVHKSARVTRAEERKDLVALSVQAKDYQIARKAVSKAPDIREDVVGAVKARIAENYKVSDRDVAEKILKFASLF